ncbi:MAG TPA: LysR family transcriptional regulator [Xanthobacteraceae bacterium]|jgi:DNA-binding transcriptional LysR family regulator|nr:LysR family transcriptional regulator [Xanthobacteraceae bacterium]
MPQLPHLPSIRQLEIFVAVARLQSFSRAAELLNTSQSALSQAVLQTEKLLGTKLFKRTKRDVKLAPAGEVLFSRAERILGDLETAVSETLFNADPGQGRVRIACLSLVATRVLPEAIRIFRSRYPRASILVRDDYNERVIEILKNGGADLAISGFDRPDPVIAFQPILEESFYFICPLRHPLAKKKRVVWRDLAGIDFVGMPASSASRAAIDRARVDAGIFQDAIYQVGRMTSVVEIVAQGGGISIVPALALIDPGLRRKVHSRLMTNPEVRRTLGVMRLRGAGLSATAEEFERILLETLGQKKLEQFPGIKILVG